MNRFLKACIKLISKDGITISYDSIVKGSYDTSTGSVADTTTNYSVTAYPRHLKATEYDSPSLIGKNAYMFYIANNSLAFAPKTGDSITSDGSTYSVISVQETYATGVVVLYRVIAVKG